MRISGSNAGYTMFRGSVKGTGYPLHSPLSPLLPPPCFTVCHHISTGLYDTTRFQLLPCHGRSESALYGYDIRRTHMSANRFYLRPQVKGETCTFCAIDKAENDDWLNAFVPKVCFRIPRDPQPVPRGSVDSYTRI